MMKLNRLIKIRAKKRLQKYRKNPSSHKHGIDKALREIRRCGRTKN